MWDNQSLTTITKPSQVKLIIILQQECILIIQKQKVIRMSQNQQNDQFDNQKPNGFQKIISKTNNQYMPSGLGRGFFAQENIQISNNLQYKTYVPRRRKTKQHLKLEPFKQSEKVQIFNPIQNQHEKFKTISQNQKKIQLNNNDQLFESNELNVGKNQMPSKNKYQSQQNKIFINFESQNDAQFVFEEEKDEEEEVNLNLSIEKEKNKIIIPPPKQPKEKHSSSNNSEQEIHIEPVMIDSRQKYLTTYQKQPSLEVHIPIRNNCTLKTQILRNNTGFNTFWPQFTLAFHKNMSDRNFLFAKKTSSRPYSTFIISSAEGMFEENSNFYQGKVKSTGMGDVLNVFGKGLNPSNAKQQQITPRQLLATIVYIVNAFQTGKPRQFFVYTIKPPFKYYTDFAQVKKYENQIPLNELYNYQENKHKIRVFRNKKPVWKEQLKGYMLNFRGRVNIASVKNFILEQAQQKEEKEVMLFGKVNENLFNADLSGPISIFICFAIALSSFDTRIISE